MRLLTLLLATAVATAQGGGPKRKPVTDWQVKEKAAVSGAAVRGGGSVLYVVDGRRLVCRGIEDGEKRWERNIGNRASPVVHLGKVWVGMDAFTLERGDRTTFEGVTGHFDAAPSFSKDTCVAGSVEGKLFCIDLKSGKLVRTVEVGPVRVGTALAGARAYVVNDSGKLRAIAVKQGREIWNVELGEPARSRPVRLDKQLYVVLRDVIVVLDTKNGAEVARIEAKGIATPLGTSKHMLFYGTRDGVVVRVDAETRRELGRISVAEEPVTGALTARDSMLYGVAGKRLFSIHARTGARVWTHEGEAPFSPPLATDGALFLAAGNVFYCLR